MELRHLRYFVAVAEEENVTRAAARLRIAQPAVSRQVRDLEEELGTRLLERQAKSVRLTDAGRLFLGEARAVLLRADEAVAAVRAASLQAQSEIHVGYAPSLTARILPRALRRMQTNFPGVRVLLHDLATGEMLEALREGRLQLALTVQPAAAELRGLRFRRLARYALCVAMVPGHALAQRRSVTIRALAGQPLIAYSRADYPEYHAATVKIFAAVGGHPLIAEEHDSVTSLIAAVEAGRGVALAPESLACLAGERLKMLPITPALPQVVVGALWRREDESPVLKEFVAAAAERESDAR
jgi:DNA-binding transcriptional LysR family regulator